MHRASPDEPSKPIKDLLEYGDDTNMHVYTYQSRIECYQHILKQFKRHKRILRDISVIAGQNLSVYEINKFLLKDVVNIALEMEPQWALNALE